MNDALYDATCDRIQRIIDRIQLELGLNTFKLSIRYSRDGAPEGERGGTVAMEVTSSWEYCEISMTVYVQSCLDFHDEYLEMVVWHEFMHVMLSPMRHTKDDDGEYASFLEERVCTDLSKAFMWTVKERTKVASDQLMLAEKRHAREIKKLNARIAELEAQLQPSLPPAA